MFLVSSQMVGLLQVVLLCAAKPTLNNSFQRQFCLEAVAGKLTSVSKPISQSLIIQKSPPLATLGFSILLRRTPLVPSLKHWWITCSSCQLPLTWSQCWLLEFWGPFRMISSLVTVSFFSSRFHPPSVLFPASSSLISWLSNAREGVLIRAP